MEINRRRWIKEKKITCRLVKKVKDNRFLRY